MWNLNYEIRENHLDKQSELKEAWENITKKKKGCNKDQSSIRKEIFDVLSKKNYDTSFETRQRDSYHQEKYRYYHDTNFYFALKTIKTILEKKTLQSKTINKIISFINEIKALRDALDTATPQSSPQTLLKKEQNSDLYRRDENGVWYFNFFEEEKQKTEFNITKPESKEHNITDNEKSSTSEQNTEDEGRDESDYSNRLRAH